MLFQLIRSASKEYKQQMFSWRNKKKYTEDIYSFAVNTINIVIE